MPLAFEQNQSSLCGTVACSWAAVLAPSDSTAVAFLGIVTPDTPTCVLSPQPSHGWESLPQTLVSPRPRFACSLEHNEELFLQTLFSSVQFSCSVTADSLQPHGLQHARPPCPSPVPRVHSNSCPLSQWRHPTISSSVVPFSSCLQSFPASVSFQMSQLFASGDQRKWNKFNYGITSRFLWPNIWSVV